MRLFVRLQDTQLIINLPKSEFCQTYVVFLGNNVGQGEVASVAVKVETILKFSAPTDKYEVMRFIGMAGYKDQSILLLFSSIFLSGNSFFLPIMLKILLEVSIFCSKLSW